MYLGRVIGTVVSSSKNPNLIGMKFLIVEKLTEHLKREGSTEVAIDSVGAGNDEIVLVCKGSSARHVFDGSEMSLAPVDAAIVGIVDVVETMSDSEVD